MSIIKSGTTTTTAYSVDANTDGDLVFIVSESLTAVTVSASANVGIGTSSPAEKLEVEFSTNGYILADNSTDTNTGIKFANTGRTYGIFTDGGSGSSNSLRFYDFTASADRLRITSDGNMGLGVTPSAWGSSYKAFDVGSYGSVFTTGSRSFDIGVNTYINSSNVYTYKNNGYATRFEQYDGTHKFFTAASGTAGTPITFTQALSVGLGTSLALQGATSQTGTGITFPATQNASSNANTLDDYEEGTWTPTITGSSTNPVYTASAASGNYTKIGRMVYVEFLIVITGVTSQGTGNVNISGLPFTNASGSYMPNFSFIYNDVWDVNMRNGYMTSTWIQPIPNAITQSNIGWSAVTLSTGYFSGAGWYIA